MKKCLLVLVLAVIYAGASVAPSYGQSSKSSSKNSSKSIKGQVVVSGAATDVSQTTLFLAGENFSPDATVTVGGFPVDVVSVDASGTMLTALLPPGGFVPGSYQIKVTNGKSKKSVSFEIAVGVQGETGAQGCNRPDRRARRDGC
jgi:hypothetical protein